MKGNSYVVHPKSVHLQMISHSLGWKTAFLQVNVTEPEWDYLILLGPLAFLLPQLLFHLHEGTQANTRVIHN